MGTQDCTDRGEGDMERCPHLPTPSTGAEAFFFLPSSRNYGIC